MDHNRERDELLRARELLSRAEALISPPRAWTQGALARDARGYHITPSAPEACRWCAVGALNRVYTYAAYVRSARGAITTRPDHDAWQSAWHVAITELARATGMPARGRMPAEVINCYNDYARSKRAVLALFRRARQAIDARLEH